MKPTAKTIVPSPGEPMLPRAPANLEETGLRDVLVTELVLKTIHVRGQATGADVANQLRLRFGLVDPLLQHLKAQQMAEIRGSTGGTAANFLWALTGRGREAVASIQERDLYVGPAPVTLEDYCEMVRLQSIRGRRVTMDQVRDVLADLVISDPLLRQLGPACNSGQSMFLYGHPGNGKTLIAERLSRLSDRPVAIPYAVEADNQIIRLFDPMIHVPVGPEEGGVPDHLQSQFDGRWVLCRRPFVVVGGELRLEQLDLTYDPQLRYYVAPLQMRANGGAFLVDDFGRQRVPPEDLLNRWIVPLEKHVDFFTLSTGKQIEVPFEALLIFSTNLAPQELVDEAFLRRIRYKVEIKDPTEAEYREIFRRVCAQQRMAYDEEAVTYLINYHYFETRRELRACHPRDLVEQIVDLARFERTQPSLTHDLIDAACHTYFIEQ